MTKLKGTSSRVEKSPHLLAVVKLQAACRGYIFRSDMQNEILLQYTDYDPDFNRRLLLFAESRKIRKLRLIQLTYREYRKRKYQRKCAKILQNTLYGYMFFFRKKIQWIKDNIGDSLVVSVLHMTELNEAVRFFNHDPFKTMHVSGIAKYSTRSTFYTIPGEQDIAVHRRKPTTVMAYASNYHRDIMYKIRFRQPVYGPKHKAKQLEPRAVVTPTTAKATTSAFSRNPPGNIFKSKLTDMIQVSCKCKGADADSQLTKLFFILKRNIDIYSIQQLHYGCAAISIQRKWRGAYCRLKMLPLLITHIVEKRAAVLMQRWWRTLMGLKKRFRILSSILTACRMVTSPTVYIDTLSFFQLLQVQMLPTLSASAKGYPEFSGIPVVNLNGQVVFKKYDRACKLNPGAVSRGGKRPPSSAGHTDEHGSSSQVRSGSIGNDKGTGKGISKEKDNGNSTKGGRCIPTWISLIKMASEHRYNSASYQHGCVQDLDGIAEMKNTVVDETGSTKKHHTSLQASFSEGKVMFNLLTNGCSIGIENFPVTYERRSGMKGQTFQLDTAAVVRLSFPSILEARCRCAALLITTMDTSREHGVCLLSQAELTNRLKRLVVLSDTMPANLLSQLMKPPSNRATTTTTTTSVATAAIVLNMDTQITLYLYNDLFSMGSAIDITSATAAASSAASERSATGEWAVNIPTRCLLRDHTPVPHLRPLQDPLEYILRVSAWPHVTSTPVYMRRERRSAEDYIRYQFFLESLKMYVVDNTSQISRQSGLPGNNVITANSGIAPKGSAHLRPSSMYRNKNSTDATGVAYWDTWEREIPNAALNGVRPSSAGFSVTVSNRANTPGEGGDMWERPHNRGELFNTGGVMDGAVSGIYGVYPTSEAPTAPSTRPPSTDRVMFAHTTTVTTACNDDAERDSGTAGVTTTTPPPTTGTAAITTKIVNNNTGLNWAEDIDTTNRGTSNNNSHNMSARPGSPRWLRRHLWSIPRVLKWCADNIDDEQPQQQHSSSGGRARGNMTGYAELVNAKKGRNKTSINNNYKNIICPNDGESAGVSDNGIHTTSSTAGAVTQGVPTCWSPVRVTSPNKYTTDNSTTNNISSSSGVRNQRASNRISTASARLDIVQHVRDRARNHEQSMSLDISRGCRAGTADGWGMDGLAEDGGVDRRGGTIESTRSPRPHSPFFHDDNPTNNGVYTVSNQEFPTCAQAIGCNNNSSSTNRGFNRRPMSAAARLNKTGSGTASAAIPPPTSPVVGSNQNIRSGKEEFIRSRLSEARGLRKNLETARHITELEYESAMKERKLKIQDAKECIQIFDLQGKLERKREDLQTASRGRQFEIDKKIEQLSDAKKEEEERNRQRIRDGRDLKAARSKHRVNVYKNNVTLNALSKYSKVTQLQEHKARERQKILDIKKRNVRAVKGLADESSEINSAAAAAFAQAAGLNFDDSSITDSLNSNELQKGILQLSDYRQDSQVSSRGGRRRSSMDSIRYITGVMIQQSVLSKTVESVESVLSRSANKKDIGGRESKKVVS